jgi:3-hydroxyacyl-CoA dehydrogenase
VADLAILTRNEGGTLSWGLVRPAKKIRGIDLLAQLVANELVRNPGRNVNDPQAGAGLRQMIGQNISTDDETEFFTDIRLRVSTAEANIKERQIKTNRPQDERLARLSLIDMIAVEELSQLDLVIEIVSESEEIRRERLGVR